MERYSSAFRINRCHNLLTLKQLRMLQRNLFGLKNAETPQPTAHRDDSLRNLGDDVDVAYCRQ